MNAPSGNGMARASWRRSLIALSLERDGLVVRLTALAKTREARPVDFPLVANPVPLLPTE